MYGSVINDILFEAFQSTFATTKFCRMCTTLLHFSSVKSRFPPWFGCAEGWTWPNVWFCSYVQLFLNLLGLIVWSLLLCFGFLGDHLCWCDFECFRSMRYCRVHVTYFFTVWTVALALRLFDLFGADCIVFAGTVQKHYFISLSINARYVGDGNYARCSLI